MEFSKNIKNALELRDFLNQFDEDSLEKTILQLEVYGDSGYGTITRYIGNSKWLNKGVNVVYENRLENPYLALDVPKSTIVGS